MQNQNNNKKVVGIILTYNCAHLVEDTFKALPKGVFDEVFVTDDGSKDNIAEVAKKIGVPLFVHEYQGYGGNLRHGLKKALEMGADTMIEIHGDGQFDQSIAPMAVEKMYRDDLDFLIGSRFTNLTQPLKDGMQWWRYVGNIGLSFIERLILPIPWTEFHAGFRVYRKRFIEKLDLNKGSDDYLYSFQIIALAAYLKAKCGEVPVRCFYGKAHTSISFKKSVIYAFKSFGVSFYYVLARVGFKTALFGSYKNKK